MKGGFEWRIECNVHIASLFAGLWPVNLTRDGLGYSSLCGFDDMPRFKMLKRRWKSLRNRLVARFLETRYGRELLVSALPARVMTMTTHCEDHVLTFSPHDYIGRKVYRKGHFERQNIARLTAVLEQQGIGIAGKVLLEVGANIGTQSIYWALSGLFRRVLSIEADPRNFVLLTRNIEQNGLQDVIIPVQCAAGHEAGVIDFYQNPDNHGKSSAFPTSPKDTQIRVAVKPVSQILAEQGVADGDIGLVWMDIEGYEPVACRSMETLMQAGVPIYMEFSPQYYGAEAAAFRQALARFYRRAFLFEEDKPHLDMTPESLPLDRGQYDILLLP